MKDIISITVITKGSQISLPVRAQRALGVKPGDKIEISIEADKVTLTVPRFTTVASLAGAAGRLDKPLSLKQMRDIAYRGRLTAKSQNQA